MRIRSIKPEFWRSDDVNSMQLEDRLLFIGLWSYVDDNGVGKDQEFSIVADLFAHDLSVSPHDTLMRVSGGLKRLHELGVIHRYKASGKAYLEIANWSKHQKINRPSPPRYPTSDADHAVLSESSVSPPNTDSAGTGEQGSRGTEDQGAEEQSAGADESVSESFDLVVPEDPGPTDDQLFEQFWQEYPSKAGRKPAREKFTIALRRATAQDITDGAHRYAVDPNRAQAYTKHAATWLHNNGWEDPPLPPRGGGKQTATQRRSQEVIDLVARNMGRDENPQRQVGW